MLQVWTETSRMKEVSDGKSTHDSVSGQSPEKRQKAEEWLPWLREGNNDGNILKVDCGVC